MFVKKQQGRLIMMNPVIEIGRHIYSNKKTGLIFVFFKNVMSDHSSASNQGFNLLLFREQFSSFLYVVFSGRVVFNYPG